MKILLTNDDGINAKGLHALINELNTIAEIYVVAPRNEQSGTGHSITVFEPIKAVDARIPGIKQGWLVGGTPVDCVKLAKNRLVPEDVDLVVSGINHGSNMGTDVLYSGTVSAAAEGVIMGYPSIAVSLDTDTDQVDFTFAAQFTRRIVTEIIKAGLDKSTLFNINIPVLPPEEIKGLRMTKLGARNYDNLFEERRDPRGNVYYWLGGGVLIEEQDEDSDVYAVEHGYVSITPIHLDLTDYKMIERFRQLPEKYMNSLLRGD